MEYGFRLPSALDNRPLKFDEFEASRRPFVSATPPPMNWINLRDRSCEQVVRPTGLLDPVIEVRPVATQVDDVLSRSVRARRWMNGC